MTLFVSFLLLILPIISNGLPLSHEKLQSTSQSYDHELTYQICGRDTTPGQVPFYASIEYDDTTGHYTMYSGVLIANRWVLTVGHYEHYIATPQVVLGDERNNKTIGVEKIYIHPDFNSTHDSIALLLLKEPVQFSRNIQPICLPEPGEDETFYGRIGMVTGFKEPHPWGRKIEGSNMQITTIIRSDDCGEYYDKVGFNKPIITESFMCAGYTNDVEDVFIPSFGNPLMVNVEKHWVLAEISMNNVPCQNTVSPRLCLTGFLRVGFYLDWIKRTVF
ncbi:brain-specific serine protease 4-like [Tetranychus urticae]|uniref:Peptidase S1 domain-containing protein n=1 Tax=Tetranychus urticae TaxID=32264 RepID=T1L3B5_TETUR|nr:brain-specific serine protease 4-like [Tetranychus urticae]